MLHDLPARFVGIGEFIFIEDAALVIFFIFFSCGKRARGTVSGYPANETRCVRQATAEREYQSLPGPRHLSVSLSTPRDSSDRFSQSSLTHRRLIPTDLLYKHSILFSACGPHTRTQPNCI